MIMEHSENWAAEKFYVELWGLGQCGVCVICLVM